MFLLILSHLRFAVFDICLDICSEIYLEVYGYSIVAMGYMRVSLLNLNSVNSRYGFTLLDLPIPFQIRLSKTNR